jgi:DNA helicase HerA-like ATPase
MTVETSHLLGHIDWDLPGASNERVVVRAPKEHRARVLRNQFLVITDAKAAGTLFLGRTVAGPFFADHTLAGPDDSSAREGDITAEIEIQGELVEGRPRDTNNRPAPGSAVHELAMAEVTRLMGFAGDMLLGNMSGREELPICLQSKNKEVIPRNVGIFGTVGAGKSNSTQVLIEEASENGWAVIVLDVESEYTAMDEPSQEEKLFAKLARFGRSPKGLTDFEVYYPVSCASERPTSRPFTLRLADFETSVIAEILQTTLPERNALLDCVEYLEQKSRSKVTTSDLEALTGLLDPSPTAKLAYTLRTLRERAADRSSRSTEFVDYQGLSTKLMWLLQSGAFDQANMKSIDVAEMLVPGRVSVFDVSVANDFVKNLVTADLLRKTFAYKILKAEAAPTLLIIEEAHSFVSREKAQTMQATLQMLRHVSRRGRKRWLAVAFVSQQPGHLPPEIFELCNTRIVHTLRSMHNLDALMSTTGDVTRELWARCPLLGTGEAVVSSPQLKRPLVVQMRPAMSRRKFVN